jgi:hypothetical protein
LIFVYSTLREGLYRESIRHNNNETDAFTSKTPIFPCVCGSFGVVL